MSFELQDLEGKPISSQMALGGSPTLLLFWNLRCLGCTGRAIPLAYEYQLQFDNLNVIGVHSNFNGEVVDQAAIEEIFVSKELPFTMYQDMDHRAYDHFDCEGTPHWVLFTPDGEVFRSFFGSQLGNQNRLEYALEALLA